MINILNESNLHKSLKALYAAQYDGKTEQAVGRWICDVVAADGCIIEIQTGTPGALSRKLSALLAEGRSVRVVAPLAVQKTIVTVGTDGTVRRRKSPKKENIYSLLRGLTGLYPLLLHPLLTLEAVSAHISEERTEQGAPVQSRNRRRRFLRTWLKTNKYLDCIESTRILHSGADYRALLPQGLPAAFCAGDIRQALLAQGTAVTQDTARIIVWLFNKLGLIRQCGTRGRTRLFELST